MKVKNHFCHLQKLWDIDDVVEVKGGGDDAEALVKWKDWRGDNTWVRLKDNPELKRFLERNAGNPESSTYARRNNESTDETDLAALRQAIFDSLSDIRFTPDGSMGRQSRMTVKVPFRSKEFKKSFRHVLKEQIPEGNVETLISLNDLVQVFAGNKRWTSRCYNTSTETYISPHEYISLVWGYKERLDFSHDECNR